MKTSFDIISNIFSPVRRQVVWFNLKPETHKKKQVLVKMNDNFNKPSQSSRCIRGIPLAMALTPTTPVI
jgi:hypothetical protein